MKKMDSFKAATLKACVLAAAIVLVSGNSADALRTTRMPKEQQTTTAEPLMRKIQLKLPLLQPVFHWTFLNKKEFLAGKLVLRIDRDGETTEIIIFEKGLLSEGWEPLTLPNDPKVGEIYFGFQSSKEYATAPNDNLTVELFVKENLEGIGPLETGVLPAGTYSAQGIYSGLLDEFKTPDHFQELPEEMLDKLREQYEFRAFLENWESQWSLDITSDKGWLPEEHRQQMKNMLEQLQNEDKAAGTIK